MRRMGSAVLGVALAAIAVGMWSKSLFVTDAAALATGPAGALQQTAAAAIAERFPTEKEMFRTNSVRAPDGPFVAPNVKGDKQPAGMYPCSGNVAFAAPACFSTQITPKPIVAAPQPAMTVAVAPPRNVTAMPAAPRDVTVERRPAPATSELVRVPVAARIAPVVAPPSCKQNLPAATARMERVLTQIKATRARPDADTCSRYRANFFEMVQVREVTALCKTGAERDHDLVRIDGTVDNINGAIAQSCESI
jgi:hypothetical protein